MDIHGRRGYSEEEDDITGEWSKELGVTRLGEVETGVVPSIGA